MVWRSFQKILERITRATKPLEPNQLPSKKAKRLAHWRRLARLRENKTTRYIRNLAYLAQYSDVQKHAELDQPMVKQKLVRAMRHINRARVGSGHSSIQYHEAFMTPHWQPATEAALLLQANPDSRIARKATETFINMTKSYPGLEERYAEEIQRINREKIQERKERPKQKP